MTKATQETKELYPKTRSERIAVLDAIAQSRKTIKIQDSKEERVIFEDNRVKLFMKVLEPFDDYTYDWLSKYLPDAVRALKEDTFDSEATDELTEYADGMTDVYTANLWEWGRNHTKEINDVLKEGAQDIISAITQAQNMATCNFLADVDAIIEEYVNGGDEE